MAPRIGRSGSFPLVVSLQPVLRLPISTERSPIFSLNDNAKTALERIKLINRDYGPSEHTRVYVRKYVSTLASFRLISKTVSRTSVLVCVLQVSTLISREERRFQRAEISLKSTCAKFNEVREFATFQYGPPNSTDSILFLTSGRIETFLLSRIVGFQGTFQASKFHLLRNLLRFYASSLVIVQLDGPFLNRLSRTFALSLQDLLRIVSASSLDKLVHFKQLLTLLVVAKDRSILRYASILTTNEIQSSRI